MRRSNRPGSLLDHTSHVERAVSPNMGRSTRLGPDYGVEAFGCCSTSKTSQNQREIVVVESKKVNALLLRSGSSPSLRGSRSGLVTPPPRTPLFFLLPPSSGL